jgi:hypothetical protein
MQVFAVESVIEPALEQARSEKTALCLEGTPAVPAERTSFYHSLTNQELISIGTPEDVIPQVRMIRSEAELDAMQPFLPVEAYEGLFLIAAGDTVSDVLQSRETRVDLAIDTEDFSAAIETAESQARFVVIDDHDTMAAILNAPLAQWRVFLHPTQHKLARSERSGPVRVLGGAGTGKTVLAMHRAKWLADSHGSIENKVFFTTFTKNLASDIEENLKTLCTQTQMQKIEVQNLDAWVHAFLRRNKYEYTIVFGRRQGPAADAWGLALSLSDPTLALPPNFYEEEFERVILAQGVTSRDEYRQAKRTGRGTVLTRSKRDAIWPVFEEYRAALTSRKLKEVDDAYRDAATLLRSQPTSFCPSSLMKLKTSDLKPSNSSVQWFHLDQTIFSSSATVINAFTIVTVPQ